MTHQIDVTLLASDMTAVKDVQIGRPLSAMPDVIQWHGRVFGRERVREPHGDRRWYYVEVTSARAD